MPPRFCTACLSPLVLLLSGAVDGLSGQERCTPRQDAGDDIPEVLFVVDGEVVEESALADPPDRIDRVEIVCWDTVERWLDLNVRNTAVLIHTRRGPSRATMASLLDLVEAQAEYRERNGAYTDDLLSLSPYAPPGEVFVYLTLSEDGWSARAEHNALSLVCHVFVGTPPDLWRPLTPGSKPWPVEREPACL